jgi:hypothetical protein
MVKAYGNFSRFSKFNKRKKYNSKTNENKQIGIGYYKPICKKSKLDKVHFRVSGHKKKFIKIKIYNINL